MKFTWMLASACALLAGLAACVSRGESDAVKTMSKSDARAYFVDEIIVKDTTSTAGLQSDLETALRDSMTACATGKRGARLEVTITSFKGHDAAKTILVGDSVVLKGSARLTDEESKEVLADYDIARSIGGGGFIAAAGITNSGVSADFANEVCHQIFPAQDE